VRGDGTVDYDAPLVPPETRLPVDPSSDAPDGYREDQRGVPGGFVGDPDVMDTWATSSLTPQIATGWGVDDDLFAKTFPMDVRPQGPEIIRTWLFSTLLRSILEHGTLPWRHAMINGWILDPDRKKMSKSRGNVVTPIDVLERFGSDAVRYWALNGRPGVDTALDEGQMKVGRRLAIKILNASKFTLGVSGGESGTADVTQALDRAMSAQLAELVHDVSEAFDAYDYARALERTERFFWNFCDDYLELVKSRAYGSAEPGAVASARQSLATGLGVLQRLFAPHLPFVTEEVWSWWQEGSVHRAHWPTADELGDAARGADPLVFDVASDVLGAIRKAKSDQRRSLRTRVTRAVVRDTEARLRAFDAACADVREAGNVDELITEPATELSVEVELAPPEEQ
jgi:valyl-tRNA synthetase